MSKAIGFHFTGYFEPEFIEKCRDQVAKLPTMIAMGTPISPLETLALHVLRDSGHFPELTPAPAKSLKSGKAKST